MLRRRHRKAADNWGTLSESDGEFTDEEPFPTAAHEQSSASASNPLSPKKGGFKKRFSNLARFRNSSKTAQGERPSPTKQRRRVINVVSPSGSEGIGRREVDNDDDDDDCDHDMAELKRFLKCENEPHETQRKTRNMENGGDPEPPNRAPPLKAPSGDSFITGPADQDSPPETRIPLRAPSGLLQLSEFYPTDNEYLTEVSASEQGGTCSLSKSYHSMAASSVNTVQTASGKMVDESEEHPLPKISPKSRISKRKSSRAGSRSTNRRPMSTSDGPSQAENTKSTSSTLRRPVRQASRSREISGMERSDQETEEFENDQACNELTQRNATAKPSRATDEAGVVHLPAPRSRRSIRKSTKPIDRPRIECPDGASEDDKEDPASQELVRRSGKVQSTREDSEAENCAQTSTRPRRPTRNASKCVERNESRPSESVSGNDNDESPSQELGQPRAQDDDETDKLWRQSRPIRNASKRVERTESQLSESVSDIDGDEPPSQELGQRQCQSRTTREDDETDKFRRQSRPKHPVRSTSRRTKHSKTHRPHPVSDIEGDPPARELTRSDIEGDPPARELTRRRNVRPTREAEEMDNVPRPSSGPRRPVRKPSSRLESVPPSPEPTQAGANYDCDNEGRGDRSTPTRELVKKKATARRKSRSDIPPMVADDDIGVRMPIDPENTMRTRTKPSQAASHKWQDSEPVIHEDKRRISRPPINAAEEDGSKPASRSPRRRGDLAVRGPLTSGASDGDAVPNRKKKSSSTKQRARRTRVDESDGAPQASTQQSSRKIDNDAFEANADLGDTGLEEFKSHLKLPDPLRGNHKLPGDRRTKSKTTPISRPQSSRSTPAVSSENEASALSESQGPPSRASRRRPSSSRLRSAASAKGKLVRKKQARPSQEDDEASDNDDNHQCDDMPAVGKMNMLDGSRGRDGTAMENNGTDPNEDDDEGAFSPVETEKAPNVSSPTLGSLLSPARRKAVIGRRNADELNSVTSDQHHLAKSTSRFLKRAPSSSSRRKRHVPAKDIAATPTVLRRNSSNNETFSAPTRRRDSEDFGSARTRPRHSKRRTSGAQRTCPNTNNGPQPSAFMQDSESSAYSTRSASGVGFLNNSSSLLLSQLANPKHRDDGGSEIERGGGGFSSGSIRESSECNLFDSSPHRSRTSSSGGHLQMDYEDENSVFSDAPRSRDPLAGQRFSRSPVKQTTDSAAMRSPSSSPKKKKKTTTSPAQATTSILSSRTASSQNEDSFAQLQIPGCDPGEQTSLGVEYHSAPSQRNYSAEVSLAGESLAGEGTEETYSVAS